MHLLYINKTFFKPHGCKVHFQDETSIIRIIFLKFVIYFYFSISSTLYSPLPHTPDTHILRKANRTEEAVHELKFRYRALESFFLYVRLTGVSLSNLHKFEFGELELCVFQGILLSL